MVFFYNAKTARNMPKAAAKLLPPTREPAPRKGTGLVVVGTGAVTVPRVVAAVGAGTGTVGTPGTNPKPVLVAPGAVVKTI